MRVSIGTGELGPRLLAVCATRILRARKTAEAHPFLWRSNGQLPRRAPSDVRKVVVGAGPESEAPVNSRCRACAGELDRRALGAQPRTANEREGGGAGIQQDRIPTLNPNLPQRGLEQAACAGHRRTPDRFIDGAAELNS